MNTCPWIALLASRDERIVTVKICAMRDSPSCPHSRRGSIYRTIFLLLPTLLLAALSQSGCGLTLTSAGGPVTPSIATQPTNQTVAVGQTATFFVTISGVAPFNYQ